MIVRRAVVVGLIAATGIVSSGFAGASARVDKPESVALASKHSKPLTKAQFIAQANAYCAESVSAFAAVSSQFAGLKKNPTAQAVAAFVKAMSSIAQKQINKTRALTPPKAEQAAVEKFLRENQTELKALEADPALLGASQNPVLNADNLARKLGLVGAAASGPCTKGSA